jgi:ribosomal protein S2
MIKSNLVKLTIKQLIFTGIHVGYSKMYMNNEIKPYLLGHYQHFHIINLYYTSFQLKILLNLIVKLAFSHQKIYVIKSTGVDTFREQFNIDSIFV